MIMKNVSRNKFLLCFRPVVDMDQLVIDSQNQTFRYPKKPSMKHSQVPSSSPSSSSCSTGSDNSLVIHSHSPRRNFSRAIRVIFFEIVLFKRVRDKKGLCDQESCGSSRRSSSFNSQKALQIMQHHDNLVIIREVSKAKESKPDSFSYSCTSESKNHSMCSKNIKNQPNPNQETKLKPKKIDYSGIHLLLISLAMTIIWGKLCAIIFTSILLYFMPRWRAGTDGNTRVDSGRKVVENKGRNKDEFNKKRVIMEGLLERHHRQSNQSHRERALH